MKGKIVLITGASSGIGKACAEAFAQEGSKLAITGRNVLALEETKSKCLSLGVMADDVLLIEADLSKDEDSKKVVEETIKKFGKLDVLVNSAGLPDTDFVMLHAACGPTGVIVNGSVQSITMEDYDRQMLINVRSPFLMSKLCLPHIIKTKGNIVNISSVTGLRAFPGVVAYNMSKAAVDQLTRTLALEVASEGVRVNAVNPGVIVTEVHKRAGMNDEAYKKFLEHGKTTHALGRVGETHEVASAVVFLASDKASFITGSTLPIDGGRSIMCPR